MHMRQHNNLLLIAFHLLTCVAYGQSDLITFSVHKTIPLSDQVGVAAFSSDGSNLAIGTRDGRLDAIDVDTGVSTRLAADLPGLAALAYSPNGDLLAAGGEDGVIKVFGPTGTSQIKAHRNGVLALAFSARRTLLVSSGKDRSVVAWDPNSGRELFRLANPSKGPIRHLVFRGTFVTGVTEDGLIAEWDSNNQTLLRSLQNTEKTVHSAAFHSSGNLLALGVEVTGMPKGNPMRPLHPADFYREQRLKLFDVPRFTLAKEIVGVDGQIRAISISPDSRFVAVVQQRVRDALFAIYDAQRGVEVASAPVLNNTRVLLFSPDSRWLATTATDSRAVIYAMQGLQRTQDVENLAGTQITVTSADRRPLLAFGDLTRIAIMDLDSLGVESTTARALTQMMRNRIVGTHNVDVIEREQMERVMKEQLFQISDRVDAQSAVRLGRLLGVQKILFGSVSKIDSTYNINVQMVNVENGRIEGVREVLCQPCSGDVLPRVIATMRTALVP